MKTHERLTGIKHNRVMVFPQGVFSRASLEILGAEGFLAAVNSTIHPVDAPADEVRFRDLMEPAVVRFGGIPLFLRHYPDRLEKIALDVFLGRQVLIVEHHGFFKDGYEKAERCIAFINAICPRIRWTDLEELCTSAFLVREAPLEDLHVQAFGSSVRLKNVRRRYQRVRVVCPRVPGRLESITWNGQAVDFEHDSAGVRCELVLEPGAEGQLLVWRMATATQVEEVSPRARERLKVFARRRLSEIRDNYLDRSEMLSVLARRGKAFLPRL